MTHTDNNSRAADRQGGVDFSAGEGSVHPYAELANTNNTSKRPEHNEKSLPPHVIVQREKESESGGRRERKTGGGKKTRMLA